MKEAQRVYDGYKDVIYPSSFPSTMELNHIKVNEVEPRWVEYQVCVQKSPKKPSELKYSNMLDFAILLSVRTVANADGTCAMYNNQFVQLNALAAEGFLETAGFHSVTSPAVQRCVEP